MLDPVTKSVIWNKLLSTSREMATVIESTSQNFITAELHDFCVGLYDATGRSVAHFVGLPGQLGAGGLQIKALLDKFGTNIHPGDVILMNDPYKGFGTHLPDITIFVPIFHGPDLVFFAMARGHQEDVGGSLPGGYFAGAYDIHAEGLLIPPIKIYARGEPTEVYEFFLNNVRFPHGMRVDNAAMIAAARVAEKRLNQMIDQYGHAELMAYIDDVIVSTEAAVRAEIAKIPDGTYYGEAATDDDGSNYDVQVWARCVLTVKGDTLTFDFSKSDKQARFVNCPLSATYASVYSAVFTALPAGISSYHNDGSYRPIEIVAPPGSCVNPVYPATVGAAPIAMGTQVIEAAAQALSQAVPKNICAAWSRHYGCGMIGVDPRTDERYLFLAHVSDGGSGAIWGYDGWPHIAPWVCGGELVRAPVEMIETYYPWRVLKYELLADSAGPGKFRGGLGIHWEGVNEGGKAILLTGDSDGDVTRGYAIDGGKAPDFFNSLRIKRGNEQITVRAHRQADLLDDDVVVQKTAGGCGVGDPYTRDVDAVLNDVRNGYVSIEGARRDYGVAIDPKTMAVDTAKTERLRALMPDKTSSVHQSKGKKLSAADA
ncbi:MAG: hydantoinase B/oxoprolinase family protein [Candidatus Eiseniibacteriota bacterium]